MESNTFEDKQAKRSNPEEPFVYLRDILLERKTPFLTELVEQRRDGWRLEGLDTKFAMQRKAADEADVKTQMFFRNAMSTVLRDIDLKYGIIDNTVRQFRFLDVGCASGGFTRYVLLANPQTRGAGITLPEEEGGHPWLLPSDLGNRFELIWHNLLSYDLGPATLPLPVDHNSFPFFDRVFDLVILDGHHLRTQAQSEHTRASDYYRLLLAQFQIGLRCVMNGGTIIMKLSRVEDEVSARVLFMLNKIANELYVHKPTSIHQNRATFYAIAKGVRYGETLDSYVVVLRKLWYDMTYGGGDGRGAWIPQRRVLEDVVPFEELTEEPNLDRLVGLGADAWKTQLDALRQQHLKYERTRRPQGVPDMRSRRGGRVHA